MVFKRIKSWLGLDEEPSLGVEEVPEPPPSVEAKCVDVQTMNEWFGQLRSMLHRLEHEVDVSYQNQRTFSEQILELLRRAHEGSPDIYKAQWVPYLDGFEIDGQFESSLFRASSREELLELNTLLPPSTPRCYTLTLKDNQDALTFASDDAVRDVTEISLIVESVNADGQDAIVASPYLQKCKKLNVECLTTSPMGGLIVRWPLKRVFTIRVNFSVAELQQWRGSDVLDHLDLLMLHGTAWSSSHLEALFHETSFPNLTGLSIIKEAVWGDEVADTSQPGDELLSFLNTCDFPALTSLNLGNMSITPDGLIQLLSFEQLPQIDHLRLEHNLFGEDDLLKFIDGGRWDSLEFLSVRGLDLSSTTQDTLKTHECLPNDAKIIFGEFDEQTEQFPTVIVSKP